MAVYKENDEGVVELVRPDLTIAEVAEAKQRRLAELELPSSECVKELFTTTPKVAVTAVVDKE